jgi:hypothetical protein
MAALNVVKLNLKLHQISNVDLCFHHIWYHKSDMMNLISCILELDNPPKVCQLCHLVNAACILQNCQMFQPMQIHVCLKHGLILKFMFS